MCMYQEKKQWNEGKYPHAAIKEKLKESALNEQFYT